MTPEQIIRLQAAVEKVADVFIEEADPSNWSGGNSSLSEMDNKARGNRYWDKKNAIQTGTLLARMLDLQNGRTKEAGDEKGEEAKVSDYEKKADALLNKVLDKARAKN